MNEDPTFPPTIVTYINERSSKNKLHPSRETTFTYHDQDITNAPPDEDKRTESRS